MYIAYFLYLPFVLVFACSGE